MLPTILQTVSRVADACVLQSRRSRRYRDTYDKASRTGTSTSGPIVAARAWSEFTPYMATQTAMASSKLDCQHLSVRRLQAYLLDPAVKDWVELNSP